MDFDTFHERLLKINDNLERQASIIIEKDKEFVLDLNREKQLFDRGIDSEGRLLRAYSNITVSIKRSKGEVYNRTTLFDTGDFYKGFDLLFRNSRLNIFSRDSKSSDLQDKYGTSIFGLTNDNEKLFSERFTEQLTNYINTYIGYGRSN